MIVRHRCYDVELVLKAYICEIENRGEKEMERTVWPSGRMQKAMKRVKLESVLF